MSVKEFDCTYVEQNDLVASYLAGRLPQVEAEAFEAHYLGCEHCWDEVRLAGEIRTALGQPAIAPVSAETRSARATRGEAWTLLAAAAAVAVIAIGIRQLTHRQEVIPSEPVYRGESSVTLPLHALAEPAGQIQFSWPAMDDAQFYVVQIFTSDGVSVWKREMPETSFSLDPGALPPRRPGIFFLAKVEALDAMGQVVAKSELKPLPTP
jgi:hypothetical protein